ncbi:MAG: Sulfur carrier protein FdhD [Verrucomicrobiae bacterium]|nr:Sulfur carrier protein FdhD [Verrucomicrobiae bacterium]
MKRPTTRVTIHDSARGRRTDTVAVEEPLEIRVAGHSIAVTMRTPGEDFELAAGFLFSEGGVRNRADIVGISYCARPQNYNIVNVALGTPFDRARFSRHVYTTSSCGICGKASLDLVRTAAPGRVSAFRPTAKVLLALPDKLAQPAFSKTGGLHAATLFDAAGNLLLAREDVGRHNALDKLIGALLLADKLPASETVLLLSGRASFELVQKAVMAGIPAVAAIGAPSSLAIDLAKEFGVNLVGFLRADRFNEYC